MKRIGVSILWLAALAGTGIAVPAQAKVQAPAADIILDQVDQNAVAGTKIILSEMIIHGRRDSRSIKSKSWIRGENKAFTEYLEPARERGIKMLKLGDQMWTYAPDADRTIAISGHMLRQSVMGSDLSYEDLMEDRELRKAYDAKVTGEDTVIERPCWVLDLVSKSGDIAYNMRKIWVDKERYVVLKEERYAKSGRLLKTLEVKGLMRSGSRWIANSAVFKDALKQGLGTEFKIDSVEFDTPIPDYLFTKASLRK